MKLIPILLVLIANISLSQDYTHKNQAILKIVSDYKTNSNIDSVDLFMGVDNNIDLLTTRNRYLNDEVIKILKTEEQLSHLKYQEQHDAYYLYEQKDNFCKYINVHNSDPLEYIINSRTKSYKSREDRVKSRRRFLCISNPLFTTDKRYFYVTVTTCNSETVRVYKKVSGTWVQHATYASYTID